MKSMRFGFAAALLSAAVLTGCTAGDEPNGDASELQDISIRLDNGAVSRAAETSANGTKAEFCDGYVFFVTSTQAIKRVFRISATETTDLEDAVIKTTDFWSQAEDESGYTFQNVPGDVSSVYMVGNLPDDGATAKEEVMEITTLPALQKLRAKVADQSDIKGVLIDGSGNVTGSNGAKKSVTVKLTPLAARVEIGGITASGDISSFKVAGIYVSHFYPDMALNEKEAGTLVRYSTTNESTDYKTTYKAMCDVADSESSLGTVSGTAVKPADSKVWAYQFLPGGSGLTGKQGIRLVVKLTDIKGKTGTYSGTQYLTVRGFAANTAGVNPALMTLERGKIYSLSSEDFTFDESDINPTPNPEDISLTIKVSVNPWTVVSVKPVM